MSSLVYMVGGSTAIAGARALYSSVHVNLSGLLRLAKFLEGFC